MSVKWETAFNALTILVSLLDIISDVYITYLFWLHAQYTYFYISISILILTQLSYCGLFVYLFRFNYTSFLTIACIIIFIVIPISPCLPFIFYFSAQHDNAFSKYLLTLLKMRHSDFNNDAIKANKAQIYQQRDPTRRFIENHFKKHIGFICESMSESFCQLLLQLFIVINLTVTPSAANETYFIRYLSILLSLLSIILSLYIFCHSIYFKLFIFNYLCIIADVVKFLTCVTCISYNHSFFNFIWIYKLLFITSIAALYISIQFISNKIDLNYNWNHIKTNFGRKRSISLSHSKSKSKSNASNKSNVSNKSNTNSSRYSNNLSTYHISSSLNRSKDNKLKEFIQIFISSNVCTEIIFFILFTCLVLILWPFIILCLEVFSFSLIALMINKFNTSRFLSIHWNLWEYVFNFLLSNKSMVMHDAPYTPSTALTAVTAGRSYTPSRSYHEQIIQSGCDDSIHSVDDYGYDSFDGTTGDNTQLDATQLEVKLNTIANAGYKTRGDRKKKKYNQRLWIKERDIPWERDKDLLMRLCVINYVLSQHRQSKKLYNYLELSLQRCFFNDVSLKELRFYSCNGFNIFKYHHLNIIEKWYATTKYSKSKTNAKKCCFFKWKKFELALKWIMFFIILPLYFVSQLLFILYPFILFVFSCIDIVVLKYIFIILYTLFIFALLCMGPSIYRFTKITSHIHYNSILYFTSYNSSFPNVEKKMIEDIHDLYINLVATQIRFDLLSGIFGKAICNLLLSYLPSFHVVYHENNYKDEGSYKELENNKSVSVGVMAQLNVFDENWTNIDRNDENEDKSLQHQKINISITPAKTGDGMKHNKHTNNNKQTSLLTTSSNISDVSNDTDISDDTTNL